ncbi:SCO4402 family protein [Streptomyces sp. CMB-StM0423]|uniref:SCO4402 family protein n=1 Tax=Streptomyces sp. CMB-StM0423 TaxID=2059884 RepID=UPI000C6FFAC5|nr:hypothetical protein [Streptomyces sp. CMB-StM0423]AUH39543.1 hypothetical protein CXR04_04105 [Streptomyces sp. CMB-StM0423]
MENPPLEYPELRAIFLEYLRDLGDAAWQFSWWVERASEPEAHSYHFDHFLDFFDDTGVLDVPEQKIGGMLRNEDEVSLCRSLGKALDDVLDTPAETTRELLDLPVWHELMRVARETHETLTRAGSV